MSDEGFITSITKILLEDAGLSADPVPANSAGAGKVDGIGIGPRGEPGARRKRRIAKARNPKLFRSLRRGGVLEMPHYKEDTVELSRYADELDEAGSATVDVTPTLPKIPDEIDPNPKTKPPSKKKLRRGDAEIVLNPELRTRYEAVLDEENPRRGLTLTQADFWIRQGLFGPKAKDFINYWRQALVDPEKAMHNATYRPYVARALRDLLDLCIDDTMLNNRIRTILTKFKFWGDEEELPEDEDVHERARFARWQAARAIE